MVTIRLARTGANKRPFYHIVVTDSRSSRGGGYFNPAATGGETRLQVNADRVNYWLAQGAQASDRVGKLIKEQARQ